MTEQNRQEALMKGRQREIEMHVNIPSSLFNNDNVSGVLEDALEKDFISAAMTDCHNQRGLIQTFLEEGSER